MTSNASEASWHSVSQQMANKLKIIWKFQWILIWCNKTCMSKNFIIDWNTKSEQEYKRLTVWNKYIRKEVQMKFLCIWRLFCELFPLLFAFTEINMLLRNCYYLMESFWLQAIHIVVSFANFFSRYERHFSKKSCPKASLACFYL